MMKYVADTEASIYSNLPSRSATIVSTDTLRLFIDVNGERFRISDVIDVDSEEALEDILAPISGKFYYTKDTNTFYRMINDEWKPINSPHQTIITDEDTTSTEAPIGGGTVDVIDTVERDANGHVIKVNKKTVTLPTVDASQESKVTTTVLATQWDSNTAIVNNILFTKDAVIRVTAEGVSSQEYVVISNAQIVPSDSDISNHNIILIANGEIPDSDITLTFHIQNVIDQFQVIDDLITESSVNALSALQGKVLKDNITTVDMKVGDITTLSTTDKTDVISAINEVFQDVDNGKTQIASAITGKGVSTSSGATFATMATNITNIPITVISDSTDFSVVTATTDNVLDGKSYYDSTGKIVSGTMTNHGALTASLQIGSAYTIPAGYHNGRGSIKLDAIEATAGTATAEDIKSGCTAYVNGEKLTGTLNVQNVYVSSTAPDTSTGSVGDICLVTG